MNTMPPELALLNQAANCLEEVQNIDTIKNIIDKADAVRAQGKKFNLSEEILVLAAAIKLKAERRLGELLVAINLHTGGRPKSNGKKSASENLSPHDTRFRLEDFDISRTLSSRAQQIAKLPEATFSAYVHGAIEANKEPTTAGVMRIAKQYLAKKRAEQKPKQTGYVSSLETLIKKKKKFATIFCDPPWPYRNKISNGAAENHYSTMTLEDILAEPVSELAEDKSHLFLWVAAGFLAEGLQVMKNWGFKQRSYFIWCKPHYGTGNYFRMATEILLFGNREIAADHEMLLFGNRGGEPFLQNDVRSWAEYPRQAHSQKPEEVREMVEKVSPGPYLEMYARSKPKPNWTAYGNQITRT